MFEFVPKDFKVTDNIDVISLLFKFSGKKIFALPYRFLTYFIMIFRHEQHFMKKKILTIYRGLLIVIYDILHSLDKLVFSFFNNCQKVVLHGLKNVVLYKLIFSMLSRNQV